jgi:hypothetical protein
VGRRRFGDSLFQAIRDRLITAREFQRLDDRRNSLWADLWPYMLVGFNKTFQEHRGRMRKRFAARINEKMALAKSVEDAAADRVDLILYWRVGLAILEPKSGINEKTMIADGKSFQPREILHVFLG